MPFSMKRVWNYSWTQHKELLEDLVAYIPMQQETHILMEWTLYEVNNIFQKFKNKGFLF